MRWRATAGTRSGTRAGGEPGAAGSSNRERRQGQKTVDIQLWRPPFTRLSVCIVPLALVGAVTVIAPWVEPSLGYVTRAIQGYMLGTSPYADLLPPSLRVDFPPNGSVDMSVLPATVSTASLTLVTPPRSPDTSFVVFVHTWATNTKVATVFLASNSSTTIHLPPANYRVMFATGHRWEGPDRLFGSTTRAYKLRRPVILAADPAHSLGDTVLLVPVEASPPPLAPLRTGPEP